jgi:tRNA pseudouridine55 synthase
VLVCLANGATRLSSQVSACEKTYVAQATFGIRTDSGDLDGVVVEEQPAIINKEDIEKILPKFTGEIMQTPPMVSAVKVGGKRLYKIARGGIEVEREPRAVFIRKIEMTNFEPQPERPRAVFEINCSGGTYIRTLVEDMGRAMGVPAVMSFLVRSAVGPFRVEDSVTMEELASDSSHGSRLLPLDYIEKH